MITNPINMTTNTVLITEWLHMRMKLNVALHPRAMVDPMARISFLSDHVNIPVETQKKMPKSLISSLFEGSAPLSAENAVNNEAIMIEMTKPDILMSTITSFCRFMNDSFCSMMSFA